MWGNENDILCNSVICHCHRSNIEMANCKNMELGTSIPIIDNVLYITSHRNRGAAWGILENKMWFFYIITVVFVVFIVFYMKKYAKTDKLLEISLGLILGGAIGNFIDRVFRQEVVDFIHVYIFSRTTIQYSI